MPRQIRKILASVRETGDRGRNTGAHGKYGRSGNPIWTDVLSLVNYSGTIYMQAAFVINFSLRVVSFYLH